MSAQILTCVIMIFWQCTPEYHDLLSIHWPPCTSHIKYLYEDVIFFNDLISPRPPAYMYIIRTPPSLNFIVRLLKFRVPGNNSIILVTTFWFSLCVWSIYIKPWQVYTYTYWAIESGSKKRLMNEVQMSQ